MSVRARVRADGYPMSNDKVRQARGAQQSLRNALTFGIISECLHDNSLHANGVAMATTLDSSQISLVRDRRESHRCGDNRPASMHLVAINVDVGLTIVSQMLRKLF